MPTKTSNATAYLQAPVPLPLLFSERNIQNSLALYLAGKLLAERYLLYWHERDAVQTPDGWYYDFETNKAAYLADTTFAAQVTGAQGLVTLVGGVPAVPRFVQRLIDDTSVGPADVVPVPAISVELGAVAPVRHLEIGTRKKWRSRHLIVDAYVRTDAEQARMKDLLALWFDADEFLVIRDHESGSLAEVGTVLIQQPSVATQVFVDGAEATTYEVLLNARLTYVA